jgi:hypothetical protein
MSNISTKINTTLMNLFSYINRLIIYLFTQIPDEKLPLNEMKTIIDAKENDVFFIRGTLYAKSSKKDSDDFEENRHFPIVSIGFLGELVSLYYVFFNSKRIEIDDVSLQHVFNNTIFGSNIVNNVLDLSYFSRIKPLPGFHNVGTKAYFNSDFSLFKILINGLELTPDDKNWMLAKMFLISNIVNHSLLYNHGAQHGNQNVMNALSKKYLSLNSKIRKLLQPHFRFQPAWDQKLFNIAFLEHNNSGNSLMYSRDNASKIMVMGQNNNHATNSLTTTSHNNSNFSKTLDAGYKVIMRLVDDFISKNNDVLSEDVRRWSDSIHQYIPYFPKGNELNLTNLKLVLTHIIWDSSIRHSMDHNTLTEISLFFGPTRTRVPFDINANYKLKNIYHKIDLFQQIAAYYAFSRILPSVKLVDVQYDSELNIDHIQFRNDLKQLQNSYKLINLERISASNDI